MMKKIEDVILEVEARLVQLKTARADYTKDGISFAMMEFVDDYDEKIKWYTHFLTMLK